MSPLANSLIEQQHRSEAEKHYPLELFICSSCLLVQLDAFETPDTIFGNYAYFSSFSDTWVAHELAPFSFRAHCQRPSWTPDCTDYKHTSDRELPTGVALNFSAVILTSPFRISKSFGLVKAFCIRYARACLASYVVEPSRKLSILADCFHE